MSSHRGEDEVESLLNEAHEIFKQARQIAPHEGVVRQVQRLFDELAKCDSHKTLIDVQDTIQGK